MKVCPPQRWRFERSVDDELTFKLTIEINNYIDNSIPYTLRFLLSSLRLSLSKLGDNLKQK
jgi:hypothetical protein